MFDAAAFLWSVIRRALGREWVVTVRRGEEKADLVTTLLTKSESEAAARVAGLAEAAASGQLGGSAE